MTPKVAEGSKGHVWCPSDNPLSDEPQPHFPAVEMSLRLVAYNGKVARKFDEVINDEVDVRKLYTLPLNYGIFFYFRFDYSSFQKFRLKFLGRIS